MNSFLKCQKYQVIILLSNIKESNINKYDFTRNILEIKKKTDFFKQMKVCTQEKLTNLL